MNFEIGQVVGGYEIIGTIGAGGMGRVYRVKNPITDRVDAMKVLLPDLTGSAEIAGRFQREVKIHASLRHPNIVVLYTAMHQENMLLMVMELVEGISLEQRLSFGTLGIGEAMDYMCQVLSALGFAHRNGVVHRDIKPSNIMITASGQVKLLDFGIAIGASDLRLTNKGMMIGSLLYMAPEQITDSEVDGRADLYSAGASLYRMVTGMTPFEPANQLSLMRAHVETVPRPPCEVSAAVEQGLSNAIMRSLEKSPDARFQSAAEFSAALAAFRVGVEHACEPSRDVRPASSPAHFSPEHLAVLERILAHYTGPIARHLVKNTSYQASNLAELCGALASQLNSTKERDAFRQAGRRELGLTGPTPAPIAAAQQAWDPAMLDKIRSALAEAIGPMAKVLVDRTARKASSVQDLCQLLSQEIQNPKDREVFLSKAIQPGPKS